MSPLRPACLSLLLSTACAWIPGKPAVLPDFDGDGFTLEEGDCDEQDPDRNPGADEIWYDGVDQDCAGDNDCTTAPTS